MITVLIWRNNEAVVNDGLSYRLKQDSDTGFWYAWRTSPTGGPGELLQTPGGYNGTRQDAKNVAQHDAETKANSGEREDPRHRIIRA